MSALAELCRQHPNKDERLLAASSLIVKLESIVEASEAILNIKDAQVASMIAVIECFVEIMRTSRFLYPAFSLPHVDRILAQGESILAKVRT